MIIDIEKDDIIYKINMSSYIFLIVTHKKEDNEHILG